MTEGNNFDVTIIGGGLGGLSLAIQLGKQGYSVAMFEKEQYPFHKVCGEYISMESWNFIESLGLPLSQMNLPFIKKLIVTAPNGLSLKSNLKQGGFGISRFKLDAALMKIAVESNVNVFEHCKVEDVIFDGGQFELHTTAGNFTSKVCCGSFGKRSNLDIKWKRHFISHKNNKLSNYVGVKYHIKTDFALDTIALHNFKNGYCGISKIEEDIYCLCYLTNAANLKENNNSIAELEKNILKRNRHLRHILENCEHLYAAPLTISQISFGKKTQVENHVLLIGDAAGMITPLCGNGMSMAMHGSKIAAAVVVDFLSNKTDRQTMEINYQEQWHKTFAKRLYAGRLIQTLFGRITATNLFVAIMKVLPGATNWLVKQTHGEPF